MTREDTMVDIHSHILYGIDDGSKSSEDTLKMLELAKEEGIKAIIATPHYIKGYNEYSCQSLLKRYEEVKHLITKHEIGIDLYLGNELSIDYKLGKDLEEGQAKTLADSDYILLEFPFASWSDYFEDILFDLSVKGYKIVIAHIERYNQVEEDLNRVNEWIHKGYHIQINSGSLTGIHGSKIKRIAQTLIQHDMVHFVATDSHSPHRRGPYLREAFDMVSYLVGEDKANQLFYTNPLAIIHNQKISDIQPIAIKPKSIFERILAFCGSNI